jgi:hypothetical protein
MEQKIAHEPDPSVGQLVCAFLSANQTHRLRLFCRPDGAFVFKASTYGAYVTWWDEELEQHEAAWFTADELADAPSRIVGRDMVVRDGNWEDSGISGLYATAALAERDARAMFPWMTDAVSWNPDRQASHK